MTGRSAGRCFRPDGSRRAHVVLAAVVLALTLMAVACGGDAAAPRAEATSGRAHAGPQGASGQFVVECALSHQAFDDPIVFPGEPGASHLHLFFGNRDVDAHATYRGLAGGATSCDQPGDTASYWIPALLDAAGRPLQPVGATAYYRAGPGIDPASVEPYPPDLKMVAGDAGATEPQPLDVVGWSCRAGRQRQPEPVACTSQLVLSVTFPDCWNGVDLAPSGDDPRPGGGDDDGTVRHGGTAGHSDHGRREGPHPSASHSDRDGSSIHVAYSREGACPTSHPQPIPMLELTVAFPAVDPDGLELASGGVLTGHADFWNVWDQDKLVREVTTCLHRDAVCGVSSSRHRGAR